MSKTVERERIFSMTRLLRDAALVVPGAAISLVAFALLAPLFVLSLGTFVIWVGALLLPLTLSLASAFAELSRTRVRVWGGQLPKATYRARKPGFAGMFALMGEPRRWKDLAYEGVIALPLRLASFVIAIAWIAVSLGGLTYAIWGWFLPRDDETTMGIILTAVFGDQVDPAWAHSFGLDVLFNAIAGLICALTLPLVMRVLARLEGVVTTAALGEPGSEGQPARPAGFARDGWTWIIVSVASVVILSVSWPVLVEVHGMRSVAAMIVSVLQVAALLIAVRLPAVGIAVQVVGLTATVPLTTLATPWPWPVTMIIVHGFLVILIALRRPWPWALAAWVLPQAAVLIAAIGYGLTSGGAVASLIVSSSITLGLAVLAAALRAVLTSRGALRREREENAALSAQHRELDERTRIAQELHDVVAHSLSVISIQATTATYRHHGLSPALEDEFGSIANSSRQALSEMRGLLALLRSSDSDTDAPLAPQPTLDDIDTLIETTRQTGASITLTNEAGAPGRAVPPLAGLAAFRIVQEALSNAVRHAPGAEISVSIRTDPREIAIDVVNGAPDRSREHTPAPGAGLGLAGATERAHALGGTLRAAAEGEGFRVSAVIPLP